MDLAAANDFASSRSRGVLSTIRRDGRPQLSNVMYVADGATFEISVTDARAKTRNLRRDPRAVLYVPGDLCFGDKPARNFVRLSYGVLSETNLVEAARRFCSQA